MKTIIVIDRQFGSGGLEIARMVAGHYGIKCYDRELLEKTAQDSGFNVDLVGSQDEVPTSSFISSLISDSFSERPLNEEIFYAQQETIRKIAREETDGCLIVGRCADVALRRHTNLVNIFIHASEPFRIERIRSGKAGYDSKYADWSDDKIMELMRKKDKEKWSYYDQYSQQRWGQSKYYDLTINSALLGIEESANQIIQVVDAFEINGGKKTWIENAHE